MRRSWHQNRQPVSNSKEYRCTLYADELLPLSNTFKAKDNSYALSRARKMLETLEAFHGFILCTYPDDVQVASETRSGPLVSKQKEFQFPCKRSRSSWQS